jgi:hypothetical protein
VSAKVVAPAEIAALSALARVEFAVIYGIGTGGGRLVALGASTSAVNATRAAYDVHRIRRDQLLAALTAARAAAPLPAAAYSVPSLTVAGDALGFLAGLAATAERAYRAQLAAIGTPDMRRVAVVAVIDDARYAATMLIAAGRPAVQATAALPGDA